MHPSLPASETPAESAAPGLVIAALSLGAFAIGTVEFSSMSLVPYYAASMGVAPDEASWAISAYALGVVVGAPLLAAYGARLPRKAFLIGLMLAYALVNIATALATNYGLFVGLRFLSGLPHGAYFGVAALLAASLVPSSRRSWAISMVMVGLTAATLAGVPAANLLGQTIGWRWGYGLAALIAIASALAVARLAPQLPGDRGARPLTELAVLGRRQVLLTLITAAIGSGGLFAVYTYVANTLQEVSLAPDWAEPLAFMIFGAGMLSGTIFTGRVADRNLLGTCAGLLLLSLVMLLIYPSTVHNLPLMFACLFLIGFGGSLGVALQTHLMDVAGEAQTMAAAMHHAAFNAANALGPWVASLAVAAGWGYPASGYMGAGLAAAGLLMLAITAFDLRQSRIPDLSR